MTETTSSPPSSQPVLLALCLGGLEDVVKQDLLEHMPSSHQTSPLHVDILPSSTIGNEIHDKIPRGEAGCGKLLIRHTKPSPETWMHIRSVQYWMMYIHHAYALPTQKEHIFPFLSQLMQEVHILQIYQYWLQYVSSSYCIKLPHFLQNECKPSFCVRCIRDGSAHQFGSMEIAKFIGEEVYKQTQWDVKLTNMDIEIVVIISNEQMVLGMNLPNENKAFTTSRLPSEIRRPVLNSSISPGLRPSTAYLMAKLAQPKKGDFLLDGMCGSGSVMVESSYGFSCLSFGGDADKQLQQTLVEAKKILYDMSHGKAMAEAMLWSAHRLPVLSNSMDCVIMDLPFSKLGINIPKHYRPKPPAFIEEIGRVTRQGTGRVVLLVQNTQQIISCLDSIYFQQTKVFPVNISGYLGYIITSNRTDVPFKPVIRSRDDDDDNNNRKEESLLGKRPYTFVDSL